MNRPVLIETSARHAHVSRRVLDILFGEGYELTKKKDLSQPGQYACEERIQVIGPKGSFPGVSILGPVRPETQVELSAGDARSIGVAAPVRESGDIAGSAPVTIIGPKGIVTLNEGCIIANRHIHMSEDEGKAFGVVDNEYVDVLMEGERKSKDYEGLHSALASFAIVIAHFIWKVESSPKVLALFLMAWIIDAQAAKVFGRQRYPDHYSLPYCSPPAGML